MSVIERDGKPYYQPEPQRMTDAQLQRALNYVAVNQAALELYEGKPPKERSASAVFWVTAGATATLERVLNDRAALLEQLAKAEAFITAHEAREDGERALPESVQFRMPNSDAVRRHIDLVRDQADRAALAKAHLIAYRSAYPRIEPVADDAPERAPESCAALPTDDDPPDIDVPIRAAYCTNHASAGMFMIPVEHRPMKCVICGSAAAHLGHPIELEANEGVSS